MKIDRIVWLNAWQTGIYFPIYFFLYSTGQTEFSFLNKKMLTVDKVSADMYPVPTSVNLQE